MRVCQARCPTGEREKRPPVEVEVWLQVRYRSHKPVAAHTASRFPKIRASAAYGIVFRKLAKSRTQTTCLSLTLITNSSHS